MTKTAKKIGGAAVAFALIVGIGFGVPEYRKAKADALVSNLCAKDGGVHIYTTVKLPPSRFNRYGEAFFPGRGALPPRQKQAKPGDDFYYTEDIAWVVPEETGGPAAWRSHVRLFRAMDSQVVSEGVSYSRRGGDPIGPWHPTSFGCPKDAGITELVTKTFVKE